MVYQQPSPWPIKADCQSNIGRVRQNNEDRGLIDLERSLFIVSDGMGGHQAGEVASEAVVTILPRMIEKVASRVQTPSNEVMEGVLRDAIVELSQRLRKESQGLAGLRGMGATVAVVWLRGS